MKKILIYACIIVVVIMIILTQAAIIKDLRKPGPTTIVTDTTYVPKDTIVYKPGKIIYKDTTIYVAVPTDVDTATILQAYFAKNIYTDTLRLNDSLGLIVVRDTISRNAIQGRIFNAHINQKVITTTISEQLPYIPVTQVYLGLDANYINKDMQSLTAGLLLKTRKDQIVGANAGIIRIGNKMYPYFGGKLYWKISLLKRNR